MRRYVIPSIIAVLIGSLGPTAPSAAAPQEGRAVAHDPRDTRGRLDIRVVRARLGETFEIVIKTHRRWRPRVLRKRGTIMLRIDTDGDGQIDHRSRIAKTRRGLRLLSSDSWKAAAATAARVTRVGRNGVRVVFSEGSTVMPDNRARIRVISRFRGGPCDRVCADRAPEGRRLEVVRPIGSVIGATLEPISGTTVPQGRPFAFRARLGNPSDLEGFVRIDWHLAGPSGDQVHLGGEDVWIAGDGETILERSVDPARWLGDQGGFELRWTLGAPLPFTVDAPQMPIPRFEDVTDASGLATQHVAEIECDNYAAGAAWGDVEGDGDLDLYLPHQQADGQLWINEAGVFADGAAAAGVTNPGRTGIGAVFADYDNDGDQDLYVVNDGPNRLYRNDGTGTFTDVTDVAGVGDAGPGSSASWGDYDADGFLDLYVTNYGHCETEEYVDDVLYHNEGDGTFTDQSALLHATGTTRGLGFQAAWFDADLDGDQDLLLANDFIGPDPSPNVFWRNDGPDGGGGWTFTDVSGEVGLGMAINTMGIALGDPDRDLDLDVALSNMGPTWLLRNDAGVFQNIAEDARVARPDQGPGVMSVTWGISFNDLNNDGWEDLYVGAGSLFPNGNYEAQPNAVFLNARDGTFMDVSAASDADDPNVTRGTPVADVDRDGLLDLYLVNQAGEPKLLRNVTAGAGHWLEIRTIGSVSNRDACGARLEADLPDGATLLRHVSCGSVGLGSGGDKVIHFGLGSATQVDELRIRWPSGTVQTLSDVAADQILEMTEPI